MVASVGQFPGEVFKVKRTILGLAEAGEPLLQHVLEAIRAHQKAVDAGRPADEVDRLRLKADHLYQTVIDYQLHKAGSLGESVH